MSGEKRDGFEKMFSEIFIRPEIVLPVRRLL